MVASLLVRFAPSGKRELFRKEWVYINSEVRMSRRFRFGVLGIAVVAAVAAPARTSKASQQCCMYEVCHVIWGDGCYGGLCTCGSTFSCCGAERPCIGSEME